MVDLFERWRAGERNFQGSKLAGANLREIRLTGADLSGSDLRGADLSVARLRKVDLSDADLTGAMFVGADITAVQLSAATMAGCSLEGACLNLTSFSDTIITGANVRDAYVDGTFFSNVDLTPFLAQQATVRFAGASTVDWRSVSISRNVPGLREFLMATGMPPALADAMLGMRLPRYQSTFISYGGPDKVFAGKLHGALLGSGVPSFYFTDSALGGEALDRMMINEVAKHERFVSVCSEKSLDQRGFRRELELILQKEKDAGKLLNVPVKLDDAILRRDDPDLKELSRRTILPFENHEDRESFAKLVLRLAESLERAPGEP
jgi:hypothetical protein